MGVITSILSLLPNKSVVLRRCFLPMIEQDSSTNLTEVLNVNHFFSTQPTNFYFLPSYLPIGFLYAKN